MSVCGFCQGAGWIWVTSLTGPGEAERDTCPTCAGGGVVEGTS